MLALRNLIKRLDDQGGWTGFVPAGVGHLGQTDQPATVMHDRCIKTVLKCIADRLRSEHLERGVTCSKEDLGDSCYSARAVANSLSILERANIIRRTRNRDARTGHEKHATTFINPALIALAKDVAARAAKAKKEGVKGEKFSPNVNLPISGWGSENPHRQGISEVPRANIAPCGVQPLHTSNGIHAPQGVGPSGPDLSNREHFDEGRFITDEDESVPAVFVEVPKYFVLTSNARADLANGRLSRRRERGQLVPVPKRTYSDIRPFLCEYEVLPRGEKTSSQNRFDGNLYDCDHTVHFEARAFTHTLDSFNGEMRDHSSLCLTRPIGRGQLPIFIKEISENGFGFFDFQKAFSLSFFKSRGCTEEAENGEQLFVKPGENSRVVLVDDLATPAPIFAGALCIVLETSKQNFQHLYCFDRVLTGSERQYIQTRIARQFGGDERACGPFQPHRCPGSVNYKKGRNQFVTRLVGTVSKIDGGKPLRATKWLEDFETSADTNTCCSTVRVPHEIKQMDLQASRSEADGAKNESELEWHLSIIRSAGSRSRGLSAEEIAEDVVKWLSSRAEPRRGGDARRYAIKTVENLQKAGHI